MVSEPLSEADAPACDTCGKTTCPDADLPAFSEPVACQYAPIYHALRDARDCDYGCARDYTNQAIRLEVVGAVDQLVAARTQALGAEVERLTTGLQELIDHSWAQYEASDYSDHVSLGDVANRLKVLLGEVTP